MFPSLLDDTERFALRLCIDIMNVHDSMEVEHWGS